MASRRALALLGITVVVLGAGVLLWQSQQASTVSSDAERACLAAVSEELGLSDGTDLDVVTARTDGDVVHAEWRYGTVRARSGVMPAGRGEVTCTLDDDGALLDVDVERFAGTP